MNTSPTRKGNVPNKQLQSRLYVFMSVVIVSMVCHSMLIQLRYTYLLDKGDLSMTRNVVVKAEKEKKITAKDKKEKVRENKRHESNNRRVDQEKKVEKITNGDDNQILYLKNYEPDTSVLKHKSPAGGDYNIDILTVGSMSSSSIRKAESQLNTWGSHISRRYFWMATEFDDPDPTCHISTMEQDIKALMSKCSGENAKSFWSKSNSFNDLTKFWAEIYGENNGKLVQEQVKPYAAGWLCAQKRFTVALSKLLDIYREGRNKYDISLPDYLIFGDDDTYVNMEIMEKELLRNPGKRVEEQNLSLEDQLSIAYPTQNIPVVWAGCRFRRYKKQVEDSSPYGGFGLMFSKAAIERMIQPLYCNETSIGFEWEACQHWTQMYSHTWIGEQEYFKPGMSISDLMSSYTTNLQPFCLHSDWATGYFVNYFNVSRHVVPTGHLHNNRNKLVNWMDRDDAKVKHARIHAWSDTSEAYWSTKEKGMKFSGNCRNNNGKNCDQSSRACHKMDEDLMWDVHKKVRMLHPKKYRKTERHKNKTLPRDETSDSNKSLPGILLAGTQKGGTSALSEWLFDTCKICRPRVFEGEPFYFKKEVHFFGIKNRFKQGLKFYQDRFHHCPNKTFAMDASPETQLFPDHVYSVYSQANELSKVKIIFTLREPISRELSWYNHMVAERSSVKLPPKWTEDVVNKDGKIQSFDNYSQSVLIPMQKNGHIFFERGLYMKSLTRWFELFDRNQILVLSYDEIKKDPEKVQWRLKNFLDLNDKIPKQELPTSNQKNLNKVHLPSCLAQSILTKLYDNHNKELYHLLKNNPGPWMEQRPFPKFQISNCTK